MAAAASGSGSHCPPPLSPAPSPSPPPPPEAATAELAAAALAAALPPPPRFRAWTGTLADPELESAFQRDRNASAALQKHRKLLARFAGAPPYPPLLRSIPAQPHPPPSPLCSCCSVDIEDIVAAFLLLLLCCLAAVPPPHAALPRSPRGALCCRGAAPLPARLRARRCRSRGGLCRAQCGLSLLRRRLAGERKLCPRLPHCHWYAWVGGWGGGRGWFGLTPVLVCPLPC